ncbi:Prosaposin [Portunus trituberculatus]|uniref:Prosaposin n=1 Tax=Portunus trituberculatus TaxID=210409 RepID=A0A5B7JVL0_PORTR|nr:Prosaposin [Portunus trituberculatus]
MKIDCVTWPSSLFKGGPLGPWEDIENAVESVCGLMPHHLSEECEDYVEAYGDQVIELLAQEIDPAKNLTLSSQVCQMIHLCPAQPETMPQKEDVSCVMCEYAITQLDKMLGDHKTELGPSLKQLPSYLFI